MPGLETWRGKTCPHGFPVEYKTQCPQCRKEAFESEEIEELGPEEIKEMEEEVEELRPEEFEIVEKPTAEQKAEKFKSEAAKIREIKKEIGATEPDLETERIGENFAASLKKEGRDNNQDSFAVGENYLAVADGVGGGPGGFEASHTVTETIQYLFNQRKEYIEKILQTGDQQEIERLTAGMVVESQKALATTGVMRAGSEQLGTTLTMALHWKTPEKKGFLGLGKKEGQDKITYAQVGDSRLYRLRDGKLERITKDISLAQELVDAGIFPDDQSTEQKYTLNEFMEKIDENIAEADKAKILKDSLSNILIRKTQKLIDLCQYREINGKKEALYDINSLRELTSGIDVSTESIGAANSKLKTIDAEKGDIYIATSDGIHDNLLDSEIEAIINAWQDDPGRMTQELVIASKIRMGEKSIDDYPELKNLLKSDVSADERGKSDDTTSVSFKI